MSSADATNVNSVRGLVKLSVVDDKGNFGTGSPIAGWTKFEVDNNNFASADTFSVTFAANALPSDKNANWFSDQKGICVELFAGVPPDPSNWTPSDLGSPWIFGKVDDVDYDPVGCTVSIKGRDLTSLLIDAKTTEKWQNKTASQIAQILAKRHNLATDITPTTTLSGKFYQIDHDKMTAARTEWDLLTQLARAENFNVWIRGQTLHFKPKPVPTAPDTKALQAQLDAINAQITAQNDLASSEIKSGDAASKFGDSQTALDNYNQAKAISASVLANLVPQQKALKAKIASASSDGVQHIQWSPPDENSFPTCNVKTLKFSRALTITQGIIVTVRSFHDAHQKVFTATYPNTSAQKAASPGASKPQGGATTYYYNKPNLTQQQVIAFAQQKYKELVQHEMKVDFSLPAAGNDAIDVTSLIQFTGTGTAWDQLYYPDSLRRELSFEDGYTLDVSAKNHSPDSQDN